MLLTTLIGLLALFPANPATLTVPQTAQAAYIAPDYSTTTIEAEVRAAQAEYGLGDDFYDTLKCESAGWKNKQSEIADPKGPNGREDSWGVSQIHLPAHKEITLVEALDPEWSIQWAAQEFKDGEQHMWSCYNSAQNPIGRDQ